jgi:hypothetical protein
MNLTNIDELVRAYEEGATIEALAKSTKVSAATIRTALIGAGVTLRRRGRPRSSGSLKMRVRGVLPTYGTVPAS